MQRSSLFILLVGLFLAPSLAFAGDPCPIGFHFYDLGSPEWLNNSEILDGLETQAPLLGINYKSADGGVLIQQVVNGSNAQISGLRAGDLVVAIDGEPAYSEAEANAIFDQHKVGDVMELQVVRDGEAETLPVEYGRQDPLLGALLRYADVQECAHVRRQSLSMTDAEAVMAAAFEEEEKKRFNCKDAHEAMSKLGLLSSGDIVVVRGSKRALIANVGWETACVKAESYDGEALTPEKIEALFTTLTGDYVADRHENP